MPVVPLGLQLVMTYSGPGGSTATNVLNFIDIGGTFDQASVDTVATAWANYWEAFGSSAWSVDPSVEALDLTVDPPAVLDADTGGPVGSDASAPLTPGCALVVSLRAASGGRSGRGRIYLPGVPDSSVDTAGTVSSGLITDLITDFTTMAVAAAGAGFIPAVYSRTDGIVRAVSSFGVSPVIDTQRRRQGRLDA